MPDETATLLIGDQKVEYSIVWRSRSTRIRIAVYPNGNVVVRCPRQVRRTEVEAFVTKNRDWIRKSIASMKNEPSRLVVLQEGSLIPLFGKEYRVVVDGRGRGRIEGKKVHFSSAEIKQLSAKAVLFDFYERKLESYLQAKIAEKEKLTGLSAKSYRIRNYKSRWGSCSPEGVISFNLKLAAFPTDVVDYVIVHELCHLRHRSHSKRFWNLVSRYLDSDRMRAELRREARYNDFG